jgi:hypothetical protein
MLGLKVDEQTITINATMPENSFSFNPLATLEEPATVTKITQSWASGTNSRWNYKMNILLDGSSFRITRSFTPYIIPFLS